MKTCIQSTLTLKKKSLIHLMKSEPISEAVIECICSGRIIKEGSRDGIGRIDWGLVERLQKPEHKGSGHLQYLRIPEY